MQGSRENSYDLLRIICAISVISIHVSSFWLSANTDVSLFGDFYDKNIFTTCLWNVLARFAVPCFMMLSGALILSDERNRTFSYFYKKQFYNIGIPMIIFILLYLVYGFVIEGAAVLVKGRDVSRFLQPILSAIRGDSHLWYLYAMTGVYVLVPIIMRLKDDIGENNFAKAAWIFLILASIGYETSTSQLSWDVGFQFRFVGYFVAGYEVKRAINRRKNNIYGTLLILVGGGIEFIIAYIRYRQEIVGISEDASPIPIISPLCPWIVVASLCIFTGFSLLKIHNSYSAIAKKTFIIYLVQSGVWDIISRIIRSIFGVNGDSRLLIPLSIVCVFLASYTFAIIWERISKTKNEVKMVDKNLKKI